MKIKFIVLIFLCTSCTFLSKETHLSIDGEYQKEISYCGYSDFGSIKKIGQGNLVTVPISSGEVRFCSTAFHVFTFLMGPIVPIIPWAKENYDNETMWIKVENNSASDISLSIDPAEKSRLFLVADNVHSLINDNPSMDSFVDTVRIFPEKYIWIGLVGKPERFLLLNDSDDIIRLKFMKDLSIEWWTITV